MFFVSTRVRAADAAEILSFPRPARLRTLKAGDRSAAFPGLSQQFHQFLRVYRLAQLPLGFESWRILGGQHGVDDAFVHRFDRGLVNRVQTFVIQMRHGLQRRVQLGQPSRRPDLF